MKYTIGSLTISRIESTSPDREFRCQLKLKLPPALFRALVWVRDRPSEHDISASIKCQQHRSICQIWGWHLSYLGLSDASYHQRRDRECPQLGDYEQLKDELQQIKRNAIRPRWSLAGAPSTALWKWNCAGIDHLKILGVTIRSDLKMTTHVDDILTACTCSLYPLCILRARGLSGGPLYQVTRATTINWIL